MSSSCEQPGQYYCSYWGCETIAPYWEKDNEPNIIVGRLPHQEDGLPVTIGEGKESVGHWEPIGSLPCRLTTSDIIRGGHFRDSINQVCTHIFIKIRNPRDPQWNYGRTWGLRYYESGGDRGGHFTIRRREIKPEPRPIDSNTVLNSHFKTILPPALSTSMSQKRAGRDQTDRVTNLFLPLVSSVFNFLNSSDPNVTQDCWLCLDPQPPYYLGIGANLSIGKQDQDVKNESSFDSCSWEKVPRLTLGDIRGKGLCIATPQDNRTSSYRDLCKQIIIPTSFSNFLKAPKGIWFACESGLTPCLNLALFKNSTWNELCITAHIIPKMDYYEGQEGFQHFLPDESRAKRAVPLLALLVVGVGIIGSSALGAAALIKESVDFGSLATQVDIDLRQMRESISSLTDSLNSLAEVVLQNRRGLDLLLLEKGGLCLALGEKCCFWANHTGVVKNSLAAVKQRLDERERKRKESQGWYETLFNWSPWMTTLISAIAGPLILVLLMLLIGPCVINALMSFIQKRIGAVKLIVMRTNYDSIPMEKLSQ
ncbi:endogenous retrovirus group S71 member 1 Env polyprotein-like [Dipodomys merriami]|uniref:endogenous retrovirus group S71 member 1 Env polyprotein-like n=1 Tax=Dipodomys merriami TaxID=94247 RepID=UPI0038560EAD